jgi:hypothetical protein
MAAATAHGTARLARKRVVKASLITSIDIVKMR